MRAPGRAAAVARPRPAQQVADAREQLARLERLGQIIVGTEFEPEHAVDRAVACGHHDDRTGEAFGAQFLAERKAVAVGQVEIEHDDVDGFTRQRLPNLADAAGCETI